MEWHGIEYNRIDYNRLVSMIWGSLLYLLQIEQNRIELNRILDYSHLAKFFKSLYLCNLNPDILDLLHVKLYDLYMLDERYSHFQISKAYTT